MEWDLTTPTASLHPDSASVYVRGHVRVVNKSLRLQGGYKGQWEGTTGAVSDSLRTYIQACPHSCQSIAKTGTTYVPCLLRLEKGGFARVQVAGPTLNRPWGAEFVVAVGHAGSVHLPPPSVVTPAVTSPTSAKEPSAEPEEETGSWTVFGFPSKQAAAQFEKDHGFDANGHCGTCEGELQTCYATLLCKGCGKPFGKHKGQTGEVNCPEPESDDD